MFAQYTDRNADFFHFKEEQIYMAVWGYAGVSTIQQNKTGR